MCVCGGWGVGGLGCAVNGYEVSFWADGNILKLR